jgi:hypothetical protein
MAAGELSDAELRRLFGVASALAAEDREARDSDQTLIHWVSEQVERSGLTAIAELLEYDTANLAKVLSGKRSFPERLRKRVNERIAKRD